VDTYQAPVFAPDYTTTVLVAKMFDEHSMHIRFLRCRLVEQHMCLGFLAQNSSLKIKINKKIYRAAQRATA
jgi:hypothetical protein